LGASSLANASSRSLIILIRKRAIGNAFPQEIISIVRAVIAGFIAWAIGAIYWAGFAYFFFVV